MKTAPAVGGKKRGRKKIVRPRKESSDSSMDTNQDKDKVVINGMVIDIENITDQELYALRKVLPREDYRLLKNRKSARKSRRRRKAELYQIKDELKHLREENERLKQIIKQKEEAEQARALQEAAQLVGIASVQRKDSQSLETACPSIFKPQAVNPLNQLFSLPYQITNHVLSQLHSIKMMSQISQIQPVDQLLKLISLSHHAQAQVATPSPVDENSTQKMMIQPKPVNTSTIPNLQIIPQPHQ